MTLGEPNYAEPRFYRSATARALPGSGLGLAIVRRIADTHDGTVEAIPLQQGMRFRISLPEIAVDPGGGGSAAGDLAEAILAQDTQVDGGPGAVGPPGV